MFRRVLSLASVLGAALVVAAVLQGDVAAQIEPSTDDPPLPAAEPITGVAVEPTPGDEQPQKDPFTPYDVGDPDSVIPVEALSAEERAVAERGRDVVGWRGIHDEYGAAVVQRSRLARAEAAARSLGVDNLAVLGVVP